MGYMLDFRDDMSKEDIIKKLHKANEALCDAIEALEGADSEKYNERSGDYYNDGYYHRDGMTDERRMSMRRMRDGRGRFM